MEQNHLDQETFSCSICLDLLKDPVTTSCGHSYCKNCINEHWDEEDQKGIHSCPQCMKTFIPRPDLQKNTMLAALMEQLKKTGLQAPPADRLYTGPEDVGCDFSTRSKTKATKSFLDSKASYGEKHLEPHYDTATFKGLCEITMDPNTLNNFLMLSEENRKVTVTGYQCYSNHPDRFSYWRQVLCRESLTGRHYWEVEWRGMGVYVAVAYKSIGRAGSGNECRFGCNDKSWALECFEKRNSFVHNNIWTPISATISPRIGVYLDHSAGILCFYSVSETMTLLHRVQTTFTEPLHAGLYLELLTDAEFCEPQ